MNKTEIAKKVSEATGLSNEAAKNAMEAVLTAIADCLASGESVQIVGFGTFSTKYRAAHTGKNPRTGETIQIAERKTVGFKPASSLKERL